jgi:PhnB protein
MPIANLSPYIHMNGTADKAIELYRSALQAAPELVTRYGDVPAMNVPAVKNWIMHAQLRIGPATLMLNDTAPDRMSPRRG